MNYVRSGQYELVKLVILTNTANPVELDIRNVFTDALVYESIFDGSMSGNVSFVDTNNLVQKYGLGRGETIVMQWFTSGMDDSPINVVGTVFDLMGPHDLNDQASGYTLHFASPEFVESMKRKLFSGHNELCSDIVGRIVDKVKRSIQPKKLNATTTRNIEHIVFSGQTPLQGIDMCSKRAISSTNLNGYLFFEDNQEFRFAPIEELYAQEPISEYKYRSSPVFDNPTNIHEESFNTYQSFEIEPPNKFIDDLDDGQYGASAGFLSLLDKSMTVHTYNAKKNFNTNNTLGKSAVSLDQNFNNDHSDHLSIHYRSARSDNESSFVNNRLKLLKSNSTSISIGTFGNSMLRVGTVIKASVPTFSKESQSTDDFDNVSGKFLIAEIKHVLTQKAFNQRIKLIKDSYEEVVA